MRITLYIEECESIVLSVCESNLKGFFSVVVDVDVVVVAEKLHKKKEGKKLVGTTPLHQPT
jgi:hypothetical protein